MVQTSVDICNNVNLDPEICLRRGEGVYSFTEGLDRKWDFKFYRSFFFFFFFFFLLFKNIYIVQTMYRKQQ